MQQFHQSLGGACRAQQIAVDLAKYSGRAGKNDHVNHRLPEMACRDLTVQHSLRALIQAPEQRCRRGDDDESHKYRSRLGPPDGGVESRVGGCVETRCFAVLCGVALHDRDGIEHFRGNGARVGDPILAGPRQLAHTTAEPHARQHHQHEDEQHLRHDIGIGPHQHRQRADTHHRIAQPHAEGRADHCLNEGGVGRQA